jgi:hypothetical protein
MPQKIFAFHEHERTRREESSLPQMQKHTSRAAIELHLRGYIQEKLKGDSGPSETPAEKARPMEASRVFP